MSLPRGGPRLTLNSQRDTPADGDVREMYACMYSGLEMQMRHFHEFIDANGMIMYDGAHELFRRITAAIVANIYNAIRSISGQIDPPLA